MASPLTETGACEELKHSEPPAGVLNRSLLAVAAIGMICAVYASTTQWNSVPVWGQPLPFIGLAALLSAVGYRLATWSAGTAQTGARGVLIVILRGLARVIPGLALGLAVDMTLIPLTAIARLANIALLQLRPILPDDVRQTVIPWQSPWALFILALASFPVLLAARSMPRRVVASLLALLAVLNGVAGWMFTGGLTIQAADSATLVSGIAFVLAGAALHEALGREPAAFRFDAAVLCFVVNTLGAAWLGAASFPLLWLTLPYMTVTAGRLFERHNNKADPHPTLGMVVLTVPLLHWLLGLAWTWPEALAIALLLSLAWGFLSWFAFERPALRLLTARTEPS
jgi:hypothetical protein